MEENIQNEKKQLLKPKNDVVFQCLFNQENEKITKAFVEALIGRKINEITINETKELYREKPDDKLGVLDLELEINNSEKVDVEVQLVERENFEERLLYYFSKLYGSTIKIGEDYTKVKKVLIIAIINYEINLTKEIKEFETRWKIQETKNPQLVLTEEAEFIILELPKVRREYEKNKENKKAQWMMFLDDPNTREVKEIMNKNEDIKDAIITVHEMSEDEKIRKLAELREKAIMDEKAIRKAGYRRGMEKGLEDGKKIGIEQGIEQGMERGIKQGIKEGIKQGIEKGERKQKEEIAKKLKAMKISLNQIKEATGLSEDEINNL